MSVPVRIGELALERDVVVADWLVRGVRNFEYDVGSLVPLGFEAYARVFHPAYRLVDSEVEAGPGARMIRTSDGPLWEKEVRWSEATEVNGRVAHPAMEWFSITGSWSHTRGRHGDLERFTQPGLWDRPPEEGSLPKRLIGCLAATLSRYTETNHACWFAVWAGYGAFPFETRGIPKVQMPERPMVLFSGPLSAATTSFEPPPWEQSPSLWWPEDHAWCVATDVDLMSTYVGASQACIDAVVADQNIEAMQVSVDQGLTYDTDTINPQPANAPDGY